MDTNFNKGRFILMSDYCWTNILAEASIHILNFICFILKFCCFIMHNGWPLNKVEVFKDSFVIVTIEYKNLSFVNPQLCILSTLIQSVSTTSKLQLWLIGILLGAVTAIDAALLNVQKFSMSFKKKCTWYLESSYSLI